MLTDSTRLMYCTFQCARQAHPALSELLPLLEKVLDTVMRERSFVVEIPDVWVNPFDAYVPAILATFEERHTASWTSSETAPLFFLVRTATAELQRLHRVQVVSAWQEPTDQEAAPTPSTALARRCGAFFRRLLGKV